MLKNVQSAWRERIMQGGGLVLMVLMILVMVWRSMESERSQREWERQREAFSERQELIWQKLDWDLLMDRVERTEHMARAWALGLAGARSLEWNDAGVREVRDWLTPGALVLEVPVAAECRCGD
jgi:hypothetical protein